MGKVTSLRGAFEQGYVRGILKAMDAVHKALRKQGVTPYDVESPLERMAKTREIEAEADAFEAFNEGSNES